MSQKRENGKQEIQTTDWERINKWFERASEQILEYKELEYNDRVFMRDVIICIKSNDNLIACLQTEPGRESIKTELQRAAITGLSVHPDKGEAALIPYWSGKNKCYVCRYQEMKGGLIKLLKKHALAKWITADIKHERDHLVIKRSSNGNTFEYEPALSNRGKPECYFAALEDKNGQHYVLHMDIEQIKEHHQKYGRPKEKEQYDLWHTNFNEMALKTVLRKLISQTALLYEIEPAVAKDPDVINLPQLKGVNPQDALKQLTEGDKQKPKQQESKQQEDSPKVEKKPLF